MCSLPRKVSPSPESCNEISNLEARPWEHSSSSPNESSHPSQAAPDVGPSLVQALALLQLKSLQEGASLASLALEAAALEPLPELCVVVVDGKPLQIQTSDLLLPSPMPLASEPRKTLSSSESDQVRNPNGTFGPLKEISE